MTIEITKLWYNPSAAAFEGRIDIQRGGKSFRYPCAIEGKMDMDPTEVRSRMMDRAMQMSDTPPSVFSTL